MTVGGLEVVDPGYGPLLERARSVLEADARVVEVLVRGSVGDGTADAWSDLDLVVIVGDADHEAFVAEWETWVAAITPTLFARRPIAPFIVNALTDEGLTIDFAIYPQSWGIPKPPDGFQVGLLSSTRYDDHASAVEYAVAELFRGTAGPFISYVQRGEHVRHLAGAGHILGLLTAVLLAESGSPPPPGKALNPSLTGEQLSMLEALPPIAPVRDAIVGFHVAVGRELVRRARPLFDRYGIGWPEELEAVARRRVREHLGMELDW